MGVDTFYQYIVTGVVIIIATILKLCREICLAEKRK